MPADQVKRPDDPGKTRDETLAGDQSVHNANGFFREAAPSVQVAGYDILKELGRGGQAVVFLAMQQSTHRKVALKVLLEGPYASASAKRRFEREVELASHLKHPNIIAVFDSGTTACGQLFYVMDYIRGVPVTQYVRDNKPRLESVLELFAVACDAVNHAHQKGVIHRDLKPSNMLVDAEGNLHILDFGLAKAITDHHETLATATGQVMGTLPYMSPEQTRGNPDLVDTRTDVYALGVVLYEMLTGSYPYPVVGEMADVLRHIATSEPKSLTRSWTKDCGVVQSVRTRTRSGCPINDEVETIALKALTKERERRYQSAGEVAKDIRHYLANEPIEAKRDSGLYLLKKTLRRYRTPVVVAVGFVTLLVAATVVLSAALRTTAQARRTAIAERDRADGKAREAQDNLTLARRNERLAEERLAESLVLGGDGQMRSGQPSRARESYFAALDLSRKLGKPDLSVLAALLESYDADAPPLMGDDGVRQTIGGFSGHTAYVLSAAFSPDGRNALSAGLDQSLRLWDVASGREIRRFTGHTGPVKCVRFLPGGGSALSGSADGKLKLWDIAGGAELRTFSGHRDAVNTVAVSPDGRSALSGSSDKALKLWDLSGGEIRSFSGHTGEVFSVAFSPDGQSIISGGDDRILRLWDATNGQEIRRFTGHGGRVYTVAFSPDGRSIISGGLDGTVRLWDAGTAREIRIFAGSGAILSAAFSSDGRTAVSGRSDQTLRLSDVASGDEIRMFFRHLECVYSVAFSPDDRCILSGSADNTLKLWDVARGKEIRRFPRRVSGALAFSPDGRTVLYCDSQRMPKLWDVATQKDILSFAGDSGGVACVAFSPDGRSVLTGGADKTVMLWDPLSGKEIRSFSGHTGTVYSVAFSSDGRMASSGGADKTVKLWDLAGGTEIRTFSGHSGDVRSVAISPDGRYVASASHDRKVKLWDVAGGKLAYDLIGHEREVSSVAFAPDGRWIASGGRDNNVILWDTAAGKRIHVFRGHIAPVNCVAFSPDGRGILSGGGDGAIRLWDVASRKEFRAFGEDASAIALGPDGRSIVSSAYYSQTLTLWDFSRVERHRGFEQSVPRAREALSANPDDLAALKSLGEWWAFRGFDDRAAELFEKAREKGGDVSALALARCYWRLGKLAEARREFEKAAARKEAPEQYLVLCRNAVERELSSAFLTTEGLVHRCSTQ